MKIINLFTFIFGAVFLFSCQEQKKAPASSMIIATGKMPEMAKDNTGNLHLVYGMGDSILYTYSSNAGTDFPAPVLVDTLPELVASATRGPQISPVKNGLAVIAADNAGNIFSFTKDQSGKWAKAARVNDVDTVDKEGFLGLSSDGNNNLFAIWPDLRYDGQNKIYGAKSIDGGKTWSKNIMIYTSPDGSVCECCKPSVLMKNNNVYVMFRNLINGNRDFYLIKSDDGGNSFGIAQKLGTGSWKLDGCPMDGGGIALNDKDEVLTVWRREDKIFVAVPGAAEKEIGEGKDCTLETMNGKNIYAWVEKNGDVICQLPNGTKKTVGKGHLPLLKSVSETQVICIWQQDDSIKSTILSL